MSDLYTLVRHSAYGYAGDYQFQRAVETRYVKNKATREAIERRGGFLGTYVEAEDRAEAENYPETVGGLIPCVEGTFDKGYKVDGLQLYIPTDGLEKFRDHRAGKNAWRS